MRNDTEVIAWLANSQSGGVGHSLAMPTAPPSTLIRTMDGHITAWSPDMEQRYGFTRSEALGQTSYGLLQTIFPRALQEIQSALMCQNSWSGVLVHRHVDGRAVITANHWYVFRDADNQACHVTETHTNIAQEGEEVRHKLAEMLAALVHELTQALTAVNAYIYGAQRILEVASPDMRTLRQAMVHSSGQLARGVEVVHLLRDLALAARDLE